MSWWEKFFSGFKGPLDFINFIIKAVEEKVSAAFDKLFDVVKGVLNSIYNMLTSGVSSLIISPYQHLVASLSFAGPFAPILAITMSGVAAMFGIWMLKRLYELL